MELKEFWLTVCLPALVIGLLLMLYKFIHYTRVRKIASSYFPMRWLRFYRTTQIYSTSNMLKRNYMLAANRATAAFFISMIPVVLLVILYIMQLLMQTDLEKQ